MDPEDYATIIVLSDGSWDTANHTSALVITQEQLKALGFGEITLSDITPVLTTRFA